MRTCSGGVGRPTALAFFPPCPSAALRSQCLLLLVPNIPEQFHRRGPVPRVVIVRVSAGFNSPPRRAPQDLHPLLHFPAAVKNRLVPRLGLLLDALAASQPSPVHDVRPD